MTDETTTPAAPEPETETTTPTVSSPRTAPNAHQAAGPGRAVSSAETRPRRPDYRGEELDPERGPGLGCFWFQMAVLGFFIVLIPIGLELNWPFELLALLLFVVIGLLLLTGQSMIFLLRLVAADRRSQGRRRPLASSTKTVGELEDEQEPAPAADLPDAAAELPDAADELDHAGESRDPQSMIRDLDPVEAPAVGADVPETTAPSNADQDDVPFDPADRARADTYAGDTAPAGEVASADGTDSTGRTHESSTFSQHERPTAADRPDDRAPSGADGEAPAETVEAPGPTAEASPAGDVAPSPGADDGAPPPADPPDLPPDEASSGEPDAGVRQ